MMASSMQILVWTLLFELVAAESSLTAELNSITGAELPDGLSEETPLRKEILNNQLDVQETPGLKREKMLALSSLESMTPIVENLRSFRGDGHSTTASSLLNLQQMTLKTTLRPAVFSTEILSDLGHPRGGSLDLQSFTTPLSIKPENSSQLTEKSLKKKPDPVEAAEDSRPLTDVLLKHDILDPISLPKASKLSSEFKYTTKPWVKTLISTSPSAIQDVDSLDTERKLLHFNSHDKKDTKLKTDNGESGFHTLAMSSRVENDLALGAEIENNMARMMMTSTGPQVPTVSLVTSTSLSKGGKFDITDAEARMIKGVKDMDQSILDNSARVKDDLIDFDSNVASSSLTQTAESNAMITAGQVENNFIDDDFIPSDQGETHLFVSGKHLASYRTTESYFTSRDEQKSLNAPIRNAVVSAYVNDMVELLREVKEEFQSSTTKDNILISGTSWIPDNMRMSHFSAFPQSKSTRKAEVSMPSQTPNLASGNVLQRFMSTEAPKQDYTTWLSSFTKRNLPDSFSSSLTGGRVLESKSKTWTERLLAHQISTKKAPISTSAQGVKMTEEIPPTPTPSMKDGEKEGMITEFFLYPDHKTPSPDTQAPSLQPHKTTLPPVQMLTTGILKLEELEQNSAQSVRGAGVLSVRSPKISATGGESLSGSFTSTTWKAPATSQLDSTARSVKLNSTQHSPGTTLQQSSSSTIGSRTQETGSRGQIKVTTQRALQRPRLIVALTNTPSIMPSSAPPCIRTNGACKYLLSNQTLLKWEDMQRTLSFAWELHVYGCGVLFVILSLISMINLIGSPILHIYNLPYVMLSNVLLFVVGLLRAVFFFTDPYGTKSVFSHRVALVLYNITFPLIITAFGILVLLLLKVARLQVLPPKVQSLPLMAMVGVIHFIILLSSDLFSHVLNPSVNVVLHVLSASWGTFLMVGTFVAYYKLRKNMEDILGQAQRVSSNCEDTLDLQTPGRNQKCLFTSSRVLLVCSIFGLLCCGLQVYAVLWLFGILGKTNLFSWSWWFLQFWFRIFELALCFAMIFLASHIFCQQCGSNEHTCWAKILRYLCTYRKTEVPEFPNNCYDWPNGIQDRVANNDISKSLIRNQSENVPLKALKDNNEINGNVPFFNKCEISSSPIVKPRLGAMFSPKAQNMAMGRSYTSICFEKDSVLSLMDLEFRPPSPINLSRSIDEALFREHLVRDSIFNDSSLQYPSYLTRQDSCSSLKESSVLNQTVDPLLSSNLRHRRGSNPDYMYSLARCSSATDINSPNISLQHSKDTTDDITTEAAASGSSLDSVSKESIKISWNPWRHGLSSIESLPVEDIPSTQLLPQESNPTVPMETIQPKKEARKNFMDLNQPIDSHSISSDTIEL
ncbi:proline-rich transmembrane protein 3 [Rhinatrema bivittatum]|uniref:proline-rich transmembrane protein 3 n=1 Tax=Rhinatrema bivittatum TaxID=194408 RepID=UPI00112E58F9|nr:proline-rich transmembrane protein 3 [Rhinatrema bivittatum]XP_029457046.1 proline-rich transmembrane protein 3 [Rhinatrema bivittatum]XP_029457047.1 proline-rich transmembrane protein 3 [Rhinatrema bivittatum]XP_029457048.1 proline-rich transmembrane protein 3 [Rhinatrema bivittatum]XP_029457050.1 proline-rich transmembrane protein 3 [Rhinatrema bivittatum]XP_029457051.1 proline-rich transmembrane protein 3 [Rhinatrema bivittatum]XP_029457052.1 proline-rich transmembrane protein 3 [Rhinat